MRGHGADHLIRSHEIGAVNIQEVFLRQSFEMVRSAEFSRSGIVYQGVDPSPPGDGFAGDAPAIFIFRNIGAAQQCFGAQGFAGCPDFQRFPFAFGVVDHHGVMFFRKPFGNCGPNAPGGAGNDGNASRVFHENSPSPV